MAAQQEHFLPTETAVTKGTDEEGSDQKKHLFSRDLYAKKEFWDDRFAE